MQPYGEYKDIIATLLLIFGINLALLLIYSGITPRQVELLFTQGVFTQKAASMAIKNQVVYYPSLHVNVPRASIFAQDSTY